MDEQIIALILAGEHQAALHQLAKAYTTPLLRFCASQVESRAEAEELMQETMLQAWEAMAGFRAESTARAWLFGIARRMCIRHRKRKQRRSSLWRRWLLGQPTWQPAYHSAASPEQRTILEQALSTLKPHLREAVLLRYQLDCDHREIAAILEIKPATARKRVSLGIKALRELFVQQTNPPTVQTACKETSPGLQGIIRDIDALQHAEESGTLTQPRRHTPPSLPAFLTPEQIERRLEEDDPRDARPKTTLESGS